MKRTREYDLRRHIGDEDAPYLWGRLLGREVRESIEQILTDMQPGEVVIAQMQGIKVVDVSFAAEAFAKLYKAWSVSYTGKALVIGNPSDETEANISAALAPLNLLALVTEGNNNQNVRSWHVIGKVADSDQETLEALAREKQATAPDLAEKLKINLTACNQRLRKLTDNGTIIRMKTSAESGGERYLYCWPL